MEMKTKKNIVKGILLIIVLGILIFLIITVPKFVIIHNHNSKVIQARQADNITMKLIDYSRVDIDAIEYLKKGNIFVMKLANNRMLWKDKNEPVEYIILQEEKQVIEHNVKDTYAMEDMWISSVLDGREGNRIWEEILMSISCHIKTENCNSKECYLIENSYGKKMTDRTWIDKQTGLIVKRTGGMGTTVEDNSYESIIEYDYTFNEMKDTEVEKPDLTGYTVIHR